MAKWKGAIGMMAVWLIMPQLTRAQGLADSIGGLHSVLDQLYDEMMPLCSQLIGVGQGIAGFAATWYIASRIWRHLANAEPIDFYPLFRPFVLGFCIMIFPSVLAMINGVMKPTVSATSSMVEGSNEAIKELLRQKEEALKKTPLWNMYVGENGEGDKEKWYKYTHGGEDYDDADWFGVGADISFAMAKASYNIGNTIKKWMSEVLEVLFQAASLCINTIRTFQLIVLAILGPLVFGIAVFDGFQHTLTAWIARYINVFLWLPVANIFGAIIGKVQEKMIELDISQVQEMGDTVFSSTDVAYLIFLIIGIVGYFTVPSIANYIVNAGGGGMLLQKVTGMSTSVAGSVGGRAAEAGGNILSIPTHIKEGYDSAGKGGNNYMGDKLSGNKS